MRKITPRLYFQDGPCHRRQRRVSTSRLCQKTCLDQSAIQNSKRDLTEEINEANQNVPVQPTQTVMNNEIKRKISESAQRKRKKIQLKLTSLAPTQATYVGIAIKAHSHHARLIFIS